MKNVTERAMGRAKGHVKLLRDPAEHVLEQYLEDGWSIEYEEFVMNSLDYPVYCCRMSKDGDLDTVCRETDEMPVVRVERVDDVQVVPADLSPGAIALVNAWLERCSEVTQAARTKRDDPALVALRRRNRDAQRAKWEADREQNR